MAPKARMSDIREGLNLIPTEEEMQRAQEILSKADFKQKRSMMNAMSSWLKKGQAEASADQRSSEAVAKAMSSRGDDRLAYLQKYLVYQKRKGEHTITNHMTNSHIEQKIKEKEWMCKYEMEQKWGEKKVKLWLDSGLLELRPDRLTGSEDPDVCEYRVQSKEVDTTIDETNDAATHAVSDDATKTDIDNLESLRVRADPPQSGSGARGSADPPPLADQKKQAVGKPIVPLAGVDIKEEKKTDKEVMIERVQALIEFPSVIYRKFNYLWLEAKEMQAKAAGHEYGQSLADKLKDHIAALAKLLAAIDKISLGASIIQERMPKIIRHMDFLEEAHEKHMKFGASIGVTTQCRAAKRRRAQAKVE